MTLAIRHLDIRHIVVPTDFSRCSDRALDDAVDLALRLGADVHLIHAYETPHGLADTSLLHPDGGAAVSVHDFLEEASARELEQRKRRVDTRGPNVVARAIPGTPHEVICEYANEHGDMVVIGSHGRTGLSHFLFGSVAERVVRHCSKPVLVIRNADDDRVPEAELAVLAEQDG